MRIVATCLPFVVGLLAALLMVSCNPKRAIMKVAARLGY